MVAADILSHSNLMIANYKLIVQHMEAKHPKEPVPSEESFKV